MSWPLDAPEPDADSPTESPALETEAPVTETEVAPKPVRRRAPRARKGADKSPDTPQASAAALELEAPVVEAEAAPEPIRRRGRRKATSEEAPAPAAAAPNVPAPNVPAPNVPAPNVPAVTEPEAPRRRGRRKAAAETETALPGAESPGKQDPGKQEAVPASAPADAPRLPRRRRGVAVDAPPPLPDFSGLAEGTPLEEEVPQDVAAPPNEVTSSEEVPVVETAAAPASSRRRRGRRGAAAVAPAPVAIEDAETRKKRRRRRGRREQEEVEDPVELAEIAQPVPSLTDDEDRDEEEDLPYPMFLPPPIYVAPRLVPAVLAPADGMPLPRTMASVQRGAGLPQIRVGDQAHAPYLFFVNTEAAERPETVAAQIREAAANGIHLFSSILYLPLKNAYGERSFQAADALVQQILAADPDGYLLPRLQFVPTNFWARTHANQIARYADGSEGDASLASADFWADCVDALEALITHFADPETPGGDRILGFHLDRGEWFHDPDSGPDLSEPNQEAFQRWLQAKYQFPYALRAAWYDGQVTFESAAIPLPNQASLADRSDSKKGGGTPLYAGAREGRWVDYALYSSDIIAQVITGLASAVKTLSAGRMMVAVSYGYTFEFCTRNDSGHLALARVLASPDIDIVAGPNSYASRAAGSPGAFGAPLDSVALHGKLWLVEDDTKTFLAAGETPDTYNPHIASGAETQAAHQRHFGAALAHGAGVTWMDLWGQGWLDAADIWQELGGMRDQAARRDQIGGAQTPPEVAVLVDEASLAYLKSDPTGLGASLVAKTRDLLLRAGGSVGFYLQSDVTHPDFPDAKLYLFLNALRVTTAERQAIRERLQRPGKTLAWIYAPALFDEKGAATQESGEVVGMIVRLQPWNTRVGSQLTETRHPLTERLRGQRRVGQDETLNPSYAVSDPQATVLAEYLSNGAASLAVREHASRWKSVFIGDPHLSLELLRGLYAYAGVHVYDPQDDVVYAREGALLLHAATGGARTLNLPRPATVYDVMENRILAVDARSFRVTLRPRSTRLFLWGAPGAVQAATGLPLPAPSRLPVTETPTLPPPPEISTPTALPLSEPAGEITARYERRRNVLENMLENVREDTSSTLVVSDLEAVLDMEDGEPLDGADNDAEADNAADETPRPRSRWQRRRAAARARRDAERQAKLAAEGSPGAGSTTPSVDIAALLPDLPPRRPVWNVPPPPTDDPSEPPSEIQSEVQSEIQGEN